MKGLVFILLLFSKICTSQQLPNPKNSSEDNPSPTVHFSQSSSKELTDLLQDKSVTTALMVLYQGQVIYEYGNTKKVSYIASCRKSILSMLMGKYIEAGIIDLDTQIGEIGIDEKDGLLPIEKKATIGDLITSRSGVHHIASNGGYDLGNFRERGSVEPGEYFVYNNWDFNVAGHILEYYTGRTVYQELESQLAIPLQFEDWSLKKQRKSGNRKKSQYLAYHMNLSTRDMAKIGQLMLNLGEWEGQQIIPKKWLQKSISPVTPKDTVISRHGKPGGIEMSYGYMWWLFENYKDRPEYKGAYTAMGYGGQYITVFPELQLVIAHKTRLGLLRLLGLKEDGGWFYWTLLHKIIESFNTSSIYEN